MVEKPLVSVLIPTRNRCRRLFTTLRSALAQRKVNLEIVVVDDGSQDDTEKMVAGLGDPRIRLVRNDSPRGESGARNRGLEETRGVWVAFLDDDDLWAPDKLDRQLQALWDTRREWAYTGDIVVDGEFRILSGGPPPSPEEVIAYPGPLQLGPRGRIQRHSQFSAPFPSGSVRYGAQTNRRLGHVAPTRPRRTAGMGEQPLGGELHSRRKHVQGHEHLVPRAGRAGSSSPNIS